MATRQAFANGSLGNHPRLRDKPYPALAASGLQIDQRPNRLLQ